MSKITKKCLGCGAILQTHDINMVGYIKDINLDYCFNCYQLMHYGKDNTKTLKEDLKPFKPKSLVLVICSILGIDSIFNYPFYRYQSDVKYTYIINQIDLLPKSTNLDYLLNNLKQNFQTNKIPYLDIILMSSINSLDKDELKNYLKNMNVKDIYLVGLQNVGKTTILKALTNNKSALSIKKAGLTQEIITEDFFDKKIHDTPGLYNKGYLHEFLGFDVYKKLIPDKTINPKIYQIKKDKSLIIEDLVAITLKSELDTSFVLYFDNNCHVHKTNSIKVSTILNENNKDLKLYQGSFEKRQFKIKDKKMQITFADLGFIHISPNTLVEVVYPKGMHVTIIEALFK